MALRLSRGSACADRVGAAAVGDVAGHVRVVGVGSGRHRQSEAVDDATVVLSDEHARKVQAAVLPKAPELTLAQLKAALARAVLAADPAGGRGAASGGAS